MSEFAWKKAKEYQEILYETMDGIAKISINRPERRNAFTPLTAMELYDAFTVARDDASIGVIILTGVNMVVVTKMKLSVRVETRKNAARVAMLAMTTSLV